MTNKQSFIPHVISNSLTTIDVLKGYYELSSQSTSSTTESLRNLFSNASPSLPKNIQIKSEDITPVIYKNKQLCNRFPITVVTIIETIKCVGKQKSIWKKTRKKSMTNVTPGFFFLDQIKNCSSDLNASTIMSLFSRIKNPKQITRKRVRQMFIILLDRLCYYTLGSI